MAIFDNKYYPLSQTVCFIDTEMETLVEEFLKWQIPLEINQKRKLEKIELNGNFNENLLKLLPVNVGEIRRFLFHKTRSNWTAIFDNTILGTDLGAPSYMSARLKHRMIRATSTEMGTIFEFSNPNAFEENEKHRFVYAIKESKWQFQEYGKPFPFENTEQYKNEKIVKNKFNRDLLKKYLKNFEIDIEASDFFINDGKKNAILINKIGPQYPNDKELTLAQAQNYYANR